MSSSDLLESRVPAHIFCSATVSCSHSRHFVSSHVHHSYSSCIYTDYDVNPYPTTLALAQALLHPPIYLFFFSTFVQVSPYPYYPLRPSFAISVISQFTLLALSLLGITASKLSIRISVLYVPYIEYHYLLVSTILFQYLCMRVANLETHWQTSADAFDHMTCRLSHFHNSD